MSWIKCSLVLTCIVQMALASIHAGPTLVEESNKLPLSKRKSANGGPLRAIYAAHGDLKPSPPGDDPGKPLFLTPLLKEGKIKEARDLSRVQLGHRFGHSYAGFFTVNVEYNSNLYFWFFPSRSKAAKAPVLVWLQGGPGGSSLFGLFGENGPFYIDEKLHLNRREYSWNANFSVLYIDNPVGTGFSFTDNDRGYARNEADVGTDLYNFMVQFYILFPELLKNDLYITGESYAGKYVPALSYVIHKMNMNSDFKINLKGMAIGDGYSDPISMTNYGDLLYEIGLVDSKERKYIASQAQLAVDLIKKKEWIKAFEVFDKLLDGDMESQSYFTNVTGLTNYYNYLLEKEPKDMNYWSDYINQAKIRKEIHVGDLTFHSGEKVEKYLEADIMKSVKPWIETIMDNYKVMFYNGQLDIICGAALTDNFIKTLNWKHAADFKMASRNIWRVDGEVAGYFTTSNDFVQVVVRNAGHMVPYDQPKWAFNMISLFVKAKGFQESNEV